MSTTQIVLYLILINLSNANWDELSVKKITNQDFLKMKKLLPQGFFEINANQGELGRTLAMNKINEIKLHLGQL